MSRKLWIRVIRIAVISGFFPLPLVSQAQTPTSDSAKLPECTKRDLEIHFGFFESPKDYFNLTVQGLNISGHPCIFEHSLFAPRIASDSPQFKCGDCKKREREGYRNDSYATANQLVGPGEIVRTQYRWKTKPDNNSVRCYRPQGMRSEYSFTWTLATPSLMVDVCSDISVVGTDVLAPRDSYQTRALWTNGLTIQGYEPLELTSPRSAYYIDEEFPLRISHKYGLPQGSDPEKCQPVFIWHRSADGTVRIEEHSGTSTNGCSTVDFSFKPDKINFSSDWNSKEAERLSNYGDQELQAFQYVDPQGDPHLHFIASDILHLKIVGSEDAGVRKWTRTKGIAADILLDRDTYKVGEDIPLHLAIANFDATPPIFSWDPNWDPCIAVGIQVLDTAGNPLPEKDRFEQFGRCTGHGFGPRPFEKGKIVSLEWSLKEFGWLPNHPGTYTIVLSWCTGTGTVTEPNRNGRWTARLKPYATVQARATIHITDSPSH